jgi:hypothetical protein
MIGGRCWLWTTGLGSTGPSFGSGSGFGATDRVGALENEHPAENRGCERATAEFVETTSSRRRLPSLVMSDVIFERIAPVVTVHDVDAALARYRRLGFATELDEPAQYGFAERGSVQLHLQPDDPNDPGDTGGVVYLYVSDADVLHAEWTSAGVEGRFMGPHNTPYGLREFIYTDPDGIVHRVGSPL